MVAGSRSRHSEPQGEPSDRAPVREGVRLSARSAALVRQVVGEVFPAPARVLLFGSRLQPDARGGDLDLLVISRADRETLERARILAVARLQLGLGDQHIDLVATSDPERDERTVVREALRTGVPL